MTMLVAVAVVLLALAIVACLITAFSAGNFGFLVSCFAPGLLLAAVVAWVGVAALFIRGS